VARTILMFFVGCMMTLSTIACGGDEPLDCTALCQLRRCDDPAATCPTAAECTCFSDLIRDEIIADSNECGSLDTCGAVRACRDARQQPATRAIDEQVRDACATYAARCSLNSSDVCSLWTNATSTGTQALYDDGFLSDVIRCYDNSSVCTAGATDQCLNAAKPSVCAAVTF